MNKAKLRKSGIRKHWNKSTQDEWSKILQEMKLSFTPINMYSKKEKHTIDVVGSVSRIIFV